MTNEVEAQYAKLRLELTETRAELAHATKSTKRAEMATRVELAEKQLQALHEKSRALEAKLRSTNSSAIQACVVLDSLLANRGYTERQILSKAAPDTVPVVPEAASPTSWHLWTRLPLTT